MKAAPASIPPTTPRIPATLRRIRLLPRRRLAGGGLLLRGRGRSGSGGLLAWGSGLSRRRPHIAKRGLQVVEDEPHGGIAARRRGDAGFPVANHEDAALARGHLELGQRTLTGPDVLGSREELRGGFRQLVRPAGVRERGAGDLPFFVEDDRGLDLRGDFGQIG